MLQRRNAKLQAEIRHLRRFLEDRSRQVVGPRYLRSAMQKEGVAIKQLSVSSPVAIPKHICKITGDTDDFSQKLKACFDSPGVTEVHLLRGVVYNVSETILVPAIPAFLNAYSKLVSLSS